MAYTLEFPISAGDPSPLRNIAAAVDQIAQRTKVSKSELDVWRAAVNLATESGYSLDRALKIAQQTFTKSGGELKTFTIALRDHIAEQKKLESQSAATQSAVSRLFASMGGRSLGLPFGASSALSGAGASAGLLGPLAAVGGIVAAGVAIEKTASGIAQYAREMTNLSQKTGLSLQESQLWTKSAEIAGVNAGALTASMRTLSRGLAEGGEEGKKQREVLDQLGISYQDSLGRLLPFGQIIGSVGEALGKMAAGPARDLAANTLLGRGGLELIPLLSRLKELGVTVGNTGVIMSDKGIKVADQYAESLTVLGQHWDALKQKMGVPIIGLINAVLSVNLTGPINGPSAHPNGTPVDLPFGLGTRQPVTTAELGVTGTRGTPTFADYDVARGNDLFGQFEKRRGTGRRDLQAELEEEKKKLSELPKPERGLSESESRKRIADVTAQEGRIKATQGQIDAIAKLKEQESALFSFEESMRNKATDPITAIFNARDELVRKQGLTGSDRNRADFAAFGGASQEITKLQAEAEKQATLREAKGLGKENYGSEEIKEGTKYLEEQTREWSRWAHAKVEAIEKTRQIQLNEAKESITSSSALSRIKFLQGGGIETASGDLQQRLQTSKSLYDVEVASAQKIFDIEKRGEALEKAKADLQKSASEALIQNAEKVLELTQKQKQEFEGLATGAFGAFLQGKSRGLDEFIKGKVTSLGTTIVGNAAGSLYDRIGGGQLQLPGQTGTNGQPNFLGKLFQKTPFGIDPVKAAQSTSTEMLAQSLGLNVQSTNKLTGSVDALALAIECIATGGASGKFPDGASPSSIGVGIPGTGISSIPGIGTFGMDVNGITGAGSTGGIPVSIIGATGTGLAGLAAATGVMSATSSPEAFAGATIKGLASLSKGGTFFGLPDFGIPNPFGGSLHNAAGNSIVSASSLIAPGAEIGMGTLGIISGLNQGGVKGGLTAAGGAAGVAAGVATGLKAMGVLSSALSAIPIVGSILGAALPLIGSLFGSNPQIRQNQISKTLENQQFYAPVSINSMQDAQGNLTSYSRTGQVRSSTGLSPYPSNIQEPYYLYPTHPIIGTGTPGVNVPGTGGTVGAPIGTSVGNVNPGGKASSGNNTTIVIHAMDSQSFSEFLNKNHQAVGDASARSIQHGGTPHLEVIRQALGMG